MFPFQFPPNANPDSRLFILVLVVMTAVNFAMGVFWILVGWRAMRAHERLPEVLASTLGAAASKAATESESPGRV